MLAACINGHKGQNHSNMCMGPIIIIWPGAHKDQEPPLPETKAVLQKFFKPFNQV